jgi:hypothetical protein
MSNTHKFLQSNPAWLPIVTHIYISIICIATIIKSRIACRYGSPDENQLYEDLITYLGLDDLLVPGPLVPFLHCFASCSAAFDWIGDFMPGLPTVPEMLQPGDAHIEQQWLRLIPFPAVMLDQLIHFARDTNAYATFEWYRNIFSEGTTAPTTNAPRNRLGPQTVASLYCRDSQFTSARTFWSAALPAGQYSRYTAANAAGMLTFAQFLGFQDNAGTIRFTWFTNIVATMQNYAQFFNGSKPLKSISATGLGACIPRGIPASSTSVRNWLYPAALPGVVRSNTMVPIHSFPNTLHIHFEHADHNLEEVAEQYALTCSINVDLSQNNAAQNGWNALLHPSQYSGSAWTMLAHRSSPAQTVYHMYSQTVTSRYHQSTPHKST